MPEPRKYQIFISSSYLDLKDQRKALIGQILREGHIPSGMEICSSLAMKRTSR